MSKKRFTFYFTLLIATEAGVVDARRAVPQYFNRFHCFELFLSPAWISRYLPSISPCRSLLEPASQTPRHAVPQYFNRFHCFELFLSRAWISRY
jgi:hypothetical protein